MQRYRGGRIKPDTSCMEAAVAQRVRRDSAERGDIPKDSLRYLYVLESSTKLIKVGYSANLTQRFNALQSASPYELRLCHVVPVEARRAAMLEKRVHELLGSRKMRGEWFAVHPATAYAAIARAVREAEGHALDSNFGTS